MLQNAIRGLMLLAALTLLNGLAFAADVPTLHQVYEAAQAGRLDEAQRMMEKVLQAYPNSSKAHYVEAELLAKQGQLRKAEEELNTAERLEPGLPFARPQAVQEIKARIASGHRGQPLMGGGYLAAGSGFPWAMVLFGVLGFGVIFFVIRALTSRNATTLPTGYAPSNTPGTTPQPYAGGGVPPASSGMGSNIMSGLATGAAVGAGMVAGEALAHRLMDGGHGETTQPPALSGDSPDASSSDDMGGTDFGINDNSSWDDDSNIADGMDDGGDGGWT